MAISDTALLEKALPDMEKLDVVHAWNVPHLLPKFMKNFKDWDDAQKYALAGGLELIEACASDLIDFMACGENRVLLQQLHMFCAYARGCLCHGEPNELPKDHFFEKKICGPEDMMNSFTSFREQWIKRDQSKAKLESLVADLKQAIANIDSYLDQDFFACHHLLEEACNDAKTIFDDVYYLGVGLLKEGAIS